jgi:hypothetical protein
MCIALKMEAAGFSTMLVTFYRATRRHIPEDSNLHIVRRENLKSHIATRFEIIFISEKLVSPFLFIFGAKFRL